MGKFIIYRRSNGEYQFMLKAGNGEVILTSEGYSSKANVLNGIEAVRRNSTDTRQYDKKATFNGKHYFALRAANGQVIGTSQLYESPNGLQNGIDSVRNNAEDAEIVDSAAPTLIQPSISRFIKERRKQLNLTQEELALKAGVGLRFIRELESGDKNTMRIDKINQVLQLFGFVLGPIPLNRNQ